MISFSSEALDNIMRHRQYLGCLQVDCCGYLWDLLYYYLRGRLFLLYTLSCLFHFRDFMPSLVSYLLGTVLWLSRSEEKNLSVGQMSLGDFHPSPPDSETEERACAPRSILGFALAT